MNSDLGTNPNRIDIKTDVDGSPVDTIEKIIAAIERGETIIKANINVDLENCYENDLADALRNIGINDIRFGTMSHYLGGGVGYTAYKGNIVENYEKIGDRGYYHYSGTLNDICHGVEKTLVNNLEKYGVKSANVDFGNFDVKSSSVSIFVSLYMNEDIGNDDIRKIKFENYVDTSDLDNYNLILKGYCCATKDEISTLEKALEDHDLEDLEPELYNFMAQEYALRTLPNQYNGGGEWQEQDESFYVERAKLQASTLRKPS